MTFVLFQFRCKRASTEYEIAHLGDINIDMFCKEYMPVDIIKIHRAAINVVEIVKFHNIAEHIEQKYH